MRLLDVTLRPARVIEVLEEGNIKVDAQGLFSMQDKDAQPPIMPWFDNHANAYSSPKVGQEVWLLNNDTNPRQLFWFRKDDRECNREILETGENVEILCNREAGMGYATIYFSDGSGWMIRNDDNYLQIDRFGNFSIYGTSLNVSAASIALGESASHPAVLGDKLQKTLSQIQSALAAVRQAAAGNAYTVPIANALGSMPETISNSIDDITSNTVTLE